MAREFRSRCPISSTLDLVGDKWTLLVIRDLLLMDKHRFADFLASGEGVSTNILTERLERLTCAGLIERRRYQDRPPRDEYHLTGMGRGLYPVLLEMVRWANRHLPDTYKAPPGMLDAKTLPPARRPKRRR